MSRKQQCWLGKVGSVFHLISEHHVLFVSLEVMVKKEVTWHLLTREALGFLGVEAAAMGLGRLTAFRFLGPDMAKPSGSGGS